MKFLHLAAAAIVGLSGGFSVACAQAQERPPRQDPEPPFGEERQDDRRERIRRVEEEIHKLETAMKSAETDERRAELKKALMDRRMHLEELLAQGKRDPRGPYNEKMARLERQIHELEMKLARRDLGPEDRRAVEEQLDRARAQMGELRTAAKMQDPVRMKDSGPPLDPESQKMHEEAKSLDHQCMEIGGKLRRLPKDDPAREELTAKLKETVTNLFEVRERLRAREVEMLKKRLQELTDMLEKRKANRDAIIEKRIKQLLGEADPLDW